MKRLKKALAWTGGFIADSVHGLGGVLCQAFHIFFVAMFGGAGLVSGGLLGWALFKMWFGVDA